MTTRGFHPHGESDYQRLTREYEEAQTKHDRIAADMREIHDKAGSDPLTRGEQERWDNLVRGVKTAKADLDRAKDAWSEMLLRGIDNGTFGVSGPGNGRELPAYSNRGNRSEDYSKAMRAITHTPGATDTAREAATVLVESERGDAAAKYLAVTADPEYLEVYRSVLIDPDKGHLSWTPEQRAIHDKARELTRAMAIGTPGAGGYAVPFALDPTFILTNSGTQNPLREIARHATITTNKWHGITTDGVTAEWKSEAAQVTDASPTLDQPSIEVHMADAWVPYSLEAEQDIDTLIGELQEAMLDARERIEATAYTVGTGSGQPEGVITGVAAWNSQSSIVNPGTDETFALEDIYNVAKALPGRHQPAASWLSGPGMEYLIRGFASGQSPNASAFWADLAAGSPPNLLGRPFRVASDMADDWTPGTDKDHNYVLLFGDFSRFQIVDRLGVVTEIVPHLFGANQRPTGQRGLLMYWRTGSGVLDGNAFRLLDIPTIQ